MVIRAVAFDFGHTLVNEEKDAADPLESRPVHLMPDVSEILPHIPVPLAVWANTRTATSSDLQQFLDRAGIGRFFAWVVTSVDAGAHQQLLLIAKVLCKVSDVQSAQPDPKIVTIAAVVEPIVAVRDRAQGSPSILVGLTAVRESV